MAHEVAPGLWAEVQFKGEVFEMEDQRNWTDASFKTYCTPLELPFPVEIRDGTSIRQCVTLSLRGIMPRVTSLRREIAEHLPEVITITLQDAPAAALPKLGLGLADNEVALSAAELQRLRELHLGHVRVDLRLSAPDWPAVWAGAVRETEQLGISLELALHLPPDGDGDLMLLHQLLRTRQNKLARVLALRETEPVTSPETLALVRQALTGISVPIGAGSDANFCELNRAWALGKLALVAADFLFWSINPQVHASDSLSIVETLEAQVDTVKSARLFAAGKPLVISPLSLRPRFNAVATAAATNLPDGLPPSVDPRQLSTLAAAWTLGSIAGMANAGVQSITMFATTGWLGVMEQECISHLSEEFPSHAGDVFPIYHILAGLSGGKRIAPAAVSAPLCVSALAVYDEDGTRRVLLGNLTGQTRRVHLLSVCAPAIMVRVLAAGNVLLAMREPDKFRDLPARHFRAQSGMIELDLPPHALACLDAEGSH
jgi:hypothetical protein